MRTRFDPAALDARDRYKLLAGLVVPRPIGWIGSRSSGGIDNLAPYSFFNMVAATPPTVLFAPGMRVRTKDTLANVRATGVFTVSVVNGEMAEAMNATAAVLDPGIDEFDAVGLGKEEGSVVGAPLVAGAVAGLECTVTHIHELGEGPSAVVVFGDVVMIHVDPAVLDGTRIDFRELDVIGRLAGPWYSRTTELFEMERPDEG